MLPLLARVVIPGWGNPGLGQPFKGLLHPIEMLHLLPFLRDFAFEFIFMPFSLFFFLEEINQQFKLILSDSHSTDALCSHMARIHRKGIWCWVAFLPAKGCGPCKNTDKITPQCPFEWRQNVIKK